MPAQAGCPLSLGQAGCQACCAWAPGSAVQLPRQDLAQRQAGKPLSHHTPAGLSHASSQSSKTKAEVLKRVRSKQHGHAHGWHPTADRGKRTLVSDFQEVIRGQLLVSSIAPQLPARDLVQHLSKGLCQAVCKGLCHDVVVVVLLQQQQGKVSCCTTQHACTGGIIDASPRR